MSRKFRLVVLAPANLVRQVLGAKKLGTAALHERRAFATQMSCEENHECDPSPMTMTSTVAT